MKIHDQIRERAVPCLRPGEVIQAVFQGQTASVGRMLAVGAVWTKYRNFVVTQGRILVLIDHGKKTPPEVVAELPRSTRLGPPHGLTQHMVMVNGQKIYVGRLFYKDIEAADRAMPVLA